MNCPEKGVWQSYLDNEVTSIERQQLEQHLLECSKCQELLEELKAYEQWSDKQLELYQQAFHQGILPKDTNIKTNEIPKKNRFGGKGMTNKIRKYAALVASILVLCGALSFSSVQDAVADFLSIFRVQKIQTVKISPEEMQKMAQDIETKVGEIDLKQFGKVDVIKKPEQTKVALNEVKGLTFEIKNPTYTAGYELSDKVSLHKDGQAEFKLNLQQANSLLRGLGSETMLPSTLDGKTFGIHLPAGIRMDYKNSDGRTGFTLSQFATPEVIVPEGVDARDLRTALLDLPIIPDDFRRQLANIDDWQNTMIIPDTGEGKIEKLNVGGNEALFADNLSGMSNLIWVDNGVLFQLNGRINRDEMIKIAQSLY